MTETKLETAAEIAARLGVKASWVERAGREGRIPSIRLGKYRRYRWHDVEASLVTARRVT